MQQRIWRERFYGSAGGLTELNHFSHPPEASTGHEHIVFGARSPQMRAEHLPALLKQGKHRELPAPRHK